MKPSSSDKETIRHQYDTLLKKNLKGEVKSFNRSIAKRAEQEVSFSALSESELNQLYIMDEYDSDFYRFSANGLDVLIRDTLLGEALNALPEEMRRIILLSFFIDMSDAEIGELLHVVRSTIFRRRRNAIASLRRYMEGKMNEE